MKADYEQMDQFVTREQILAAKGVELSLLISKYMMYDSTIINVAGEILEIPSKDYAIDISAAWEVVETLKRKGLLIVMVDAPKDYYHFRVFQNGNGWRGFSANTAPEAICKAALLAVLEAANG